MKFQPDPMENKEISFGPFRLDLKRPELRRDDQPVRLHPRALGILCALAEAKGEIVGKDALMARLWPDRIVEDTSTFRLCESRWARTAKATATLSPFRVAVIDWRVSPAQLRKILRWLLRPDRCHSPTSRRSQSRRSTILTATQSSNTSPTAWSRRSSLR